MKQVIVNIHKNIQENLNLPYGNGWEQLLMIHDEVQLTVKREYGNRIGELGVKAIAIAGEKYNFRIPLTGEFKTGANWATTH